jgi:hypothetical protein
MKKILPIKRNLLIVLVSFLIVPATSISNVLNIPEKIQEKDQWCWAACSESVLDYYRTVLTQTEIAEYGTLGANIENWLYGYTTNPTKRGVDRILDHFGGISSMGSSTVLSQATVQDEISAGRPIVIRWGWTSGGGHHIVAHGVRDNRIYLMDPWNGSTINSYDWVLDGSNHTWTDSLQIYTNPPLIPPQAPANLSIDNNTTIKWDANAEMVTRYRIYYGVEQGEYTSSLDIGNVTQYTLNTLNLPDGVTHYLAVTAQNDAGESSFSNEMAWTPSLPAAPSSPTNIIMH